MNCSTSCCKRIRNTAISIITFALGLGLIASSHAQTAQSYRSKADQKEVQMKTTRILAVVLLIVASGLGLHVARAQQPGTKRTDLQRHDLSAPGREVVQVRVDFDPGYVSPKHTHPGEEIIYVLEGTLVYHIEGKPTVTVKPGEVLFVPAGAIHWATNVGSGNGAELATYVVEKGKPLITLVK
jgi:quercetin dioxygenase-like cupin family protein